MKILVCGGRDFVGTAYVNQVLSMIHEDHPVTCVVHGDAPGADTLGKNWAIENNIPHIPYPAEWDKYKHAAGPIRNGQMLRENPDIELVVVFPGGRGTSNMRTQAEKANIQTLLA